MADSAHRFAATNAFSESICALGLCEECVSDILDSLLVCAGFELTRDSVGRVPILHRLILLLALREVEVECLLGRHRLAEMQIHLRVVALL